MILALSGYKLLADLVTLLHFAYVAFVVVGLVLVWIGYFLRWDWVRGLFFRLAHLVAMAIVVIEAVFGVTCPLTTWEFELRRLAGDGGDSEKSFVAEWVHRLMFFELDESTFTVIYVVFFLALAASFVLVRPRAPRRWNVANAARTPRRPEPSPGRDEKQP